MDVFVTAVVSLLTAFGGWFVGRRKRNNDFLGELQNSIDLLTEKYTKTLSELIEVKEQNAKLLIGQNEMSLELKAVREENCLLKKEVEELTSQLQNVKIITRQAK